MIRSIASAFVVGVACLATISVPSAIAAPDFSSATAGWNTPIAGDFMPVPGAPAPVLSDPRYPFYNNVEANARGLSPNYRIGDLTNPNLKPPIKEAMKKDIDEVLAGKIAFTPSTSCVPAGVPWFLLQPGTLYFVQTPKEVLLIWQSDHMVRRVYLTDKHSPNPKPSWFGESIGHYEGGNTLVIDTIGLNTKTYVDNYRTPHTDKLHVVERYKLVNAETAIEVTVTVEDPGAFTTPWSAMQRYHRVELGTMGESTCAEGNFNYFNLDLDPLPEDDHPAF
jgi:hypothetical protein